LAVFGQQKTKPIYWRSTFKVQSSGLKSGKGNLKKQSQYTGRWPEIRNDTNGYGMIAAKAQFTEPYLKKQSQFAGGLIWRKVLFERKLWQYTGLRSRKKQTQTKPIRQEGIAGQVFVGSILYFR
jgi:hypothetical protein